MAKLRGKLGEWDLPHVHMWKDRQSTIKCRRRPLIGPNTRVATIGSCFAQELAAAMFVRGIPVEMHPGGVFYDTKSIRQGFERMFGRGQTTEPMWNVRGGFVHPFQDYGEIHRTEAAALEFGRSIGSKAKELFRSAEVIVITLGLIEAWFQPKTGNYYRQIPHPEIFPTLDVEFRRLTFAEMTEDLSVIRDLVRANTKAELIMTASPIPLHATMTDLDIRVANTESKSRIRAVISEFVERHPEIHYFHSYEMVTTAERASDFMKADGRHVHARAVAYIMHEFLRSFGSDTLQPEPIDTSWLAAPDKTADRNPREKSLRDELMQRVQRLPSAALRRLFPKRSTQTRPQ